MSVSFLVGCFIYWRTLHPVKAKWKYAAAVPLALATLKFPLVWLLGGPRIFAPELPWWAIIFAGWLWGMDIPIIKPIWTSSMVLYSSGWCFVLMALFYFLFDVCHLTFGLDFLRVYGMNSITAYVLSEVVNFRGIAHSLLYGLEQYIGSYYAFVLTLSQVAIVFLLLYAMYRRNIFLKV